jgi:hypothetical protein
MHIDKFTFGKFTRLFAPVGLELAKLHQFGSIKYRGKDVHLSPPEAYLEAAYRHLLQFEHIGESDFDAESGAHHLTAAIWNLMAARLCQIWQKH